jgi:hypothetical protein
MEAKPQNHAGGNERRRCYRTSANAQKQLCYIILATVAFFATTDTFRK